PLSFFLFSRRRRHTSFSRDWSSDVCSSDLLILPRTIESLRTEIGQPGRGDLFVQLLGELQTRQVDAHIFRRLQGDAHIFDEMLRSEERRLGKECRSEGSHARDKW